MKTGNTMDLLKVDFNYGFVSTFGFLFTYLNYTYENYPFTMNTSSTYVVCMIIICFNIKLLEKRSALNLTWIKKQKAIIPIDWQQ